MGLTPARVLVAHNFYQWRGGEDAVVEAEVELLRGHGHVVELFARHSREAAGIHPAKLACDAVWSTATTRRCAELIDSFRPDVVHLHNTVPLISPSIVWAARKAAVPVVQTLHNFRLLCPQGMLLRDGHICEACVGKLPWRSVAYGCYRRSRGQSAVMTAAAGVHGILGTYRRGISKFIVLSEFAKGKFVAGGLPGARIVVKPNFVDLPPASEAGIRTGGLFVGRLSEEKGTRLLAEAATAAGVPIDVVGEGPDENRLRAVSNLHLLGRADPAEVYRRMRTASFLVVPSVSHETFGRVVVEAYACGLPVIAGRLGALEELVISGTTGLLVGPGSAQALAQAIRWATDHPDDLRIWGRQARARYEQYFSAARNYRVLSAIYEDVVAAPHSVHSTVTMP